MVNTFHHRRGGDAVYALDLSELLRGVGHEVVPFAMRHPENIPSAWDRWFAPWVDFRDLDSPRSALRAARAFAWNRRAGSLFRSLLLKVRPDVVHIHHVHHHLSPSVVTEAHRQGIPVVWTTHDYELICPNGLLFTQGAPCTACRGHRYHNAVLRRCKRGERAPSLLAATENAAHAALGVSRRVTRFLTPSAFLGERLADFGIDPERIFHQPNFVSVPEGLAPHGRGVVFAGRLSQEKGVHTLLRAARELDDYPVTICGTGPLRAELEAQVADLPHVRFTGHLPRETLLRVLASAAIVVVPSLWWENFPYAVTEAQSLGRAVIGSRTGGIPEQITDGHDGRLIAPGDADALVRVIRDLIDDPEHARTLGLRGRERVQTTLAPEQHLRSIENHYAAVM